MNAILQAIVSDTNIAPEFRAAVSEHQVRRAAYIAILKRHDWHYERNDTGRYGDAKRDHDAILSAQPSVDPSWSLHNAYAPAEFWRLGGAS